ncbi:hypothetical protein KKF61_05595 [Patescibacteria group bacterium]|nr:hypothetical protein [Patescibacteria group bacterium]MBU0963980.1 hypothetical protein [Patescibacteria group bacterium]
MKTVLCLLICLVLLITNATAATHTLKVKQNIGKQATLYYINTAENWNWYLLYQTGDKPWLMAGLGPRYVTAKLQINGFLFNRLEIRDTEWPVKDWGTDLFLTWQIGRWTFFNRTLALKDLIDPDLDWWSWGRYYTSY